MPPFGYGLTFEFGLFFFAGKSDLKSEFGLLSFFFFEENAIAFYINSE